MSNPQLLLVEDNELNRDMLSRRLKRAGFDALIAEDGAKALDCIESEHPDLVLLDMNLPLIDGWTVCKRVRANSALAGTPIIALTAHAMPEDRDKAIAAGCDDYATKPIDFPALLEKIKRLLESRKLQT
ncbi:response regulator [Congregibacter litoralis]|uniref:Response regulator n=1 Tax=Congregibacter litoralis KT71 TaxID=314285 RepID=A4ADF0_9GAMM|nr:response regulator [Congregibacter litoralis]EAQ95948.1 Response regulator [Congregibacter litoralis KT71]